MKKAKLAREMLAHCKRPDIDPAQLRDKSPDEVILAYIKCTCCDNLIIPSTAIDPYVAYARDVYHFFELCDNTAEELSEVMARISEGGNEGGDDVLSPTMH